MPRSNDQMVVEFYEQYLAALVAYKGNFQVGSKEANAVDGQIKKCEAFLAHLPALGKENSPANKRSGSFRLFSKKPVPPRLIDCPVPPSSENPSQNVRFMLAMFAEMKNAYEPAKFLREAIAYARSILASLSEHATENSNNSVEDKEITAAFVEMVSMLYNKLPDKMKADIMAVAKSKEYQDLCSAVNVLPINDDIQSGYDILNSIFGKLNLGIQKIAVPNESNVKKSGAAKQDQLGDRDYLAHNKAAVNDVLVNLTDKDNIERLTQRYTYYIKAILANEDEIHRAIIGRESIRSADGKPITDVRQGIDENGMILKTVTVDDKRVGLGEYGATDLSLAECVKYDAVFSEAERLVRKEFEVEMNTLLTNPGELSLQRYEQLSAYINQARVNAATNVLHDTVKPESLLMSSSTRSV